jgi:hypothetical protein
MKAAEAAICPTMHAPPIEDLWTISHSKLFQIFGSCSRHLPTTPVLEFAKDITNRSSRSQNPERDDDHEKADEEHDEDNALEQRKVLSGESIE